MSVALDYYRYLTYNLFFGGSMVEHANATCSGFFTVLLVILMVQLVFDTYQLTLDLELVLLVKYIMIMCYLILMFLLWSYVGNELEYEALLDLNTSITRHDCILLEYVFLYCSPSYWQRPPTPATGRTEISTSGTALASSFVKCNDPCSSP